MAKTISYRVEVLRNGATLTVLNSVVAPRINFSSEAEIKTSMSGTFINDTSVDYFNDELKPIVTINGVDFPLGVFLVSRKKEQISVSDYISLDCYDRSFVLKSTVMETIYHISAGSNYITTIEGLLISAGLPLFISTPNPAIFATAREDWEVGTDYLTIINELLAEINYNSIWFNQDGYAVLEPIQQTDASLISHRYGGEITLTRKDVQSEADWFSQPNVFIAICDNPERGDTPLVATAENNNPLSSLSIFKRGRRITKVYKVSNIATQSELEIYAQRLAMDSMFQSETITFETEIEPGHALHDICAINHPNIEGIFEEVSWQMTLAAGVTMKHVARRTLIV